MTEINIKVIGWKERSTDMEPTLKRLAAANLCMKVVIKKTKSTEEVKLAGRMEIGTTVIGKTVRNMVKGLLEKYQMVMVGFIKEPIRITINIYMVS